MASVPKARNTQQKRRYIPGLCGGCNFMHTSNKKTLLKAATRGHVGCVKAVLNEGADVNSADEVNGGTVLMFSTINGHTECFKLLLKRENYVNKPDKYGVAALMTAAYNGHYQCLDLFTKSGADVNKQC